MFPYRKTLPHGVPSWVGEGSVYFITVSCVPRRYNQLCVPKTANLLRETVAFRHSRKEWWVRLFILMPDHCHALISFNRAVSMRDSIANWKRFTARTIDIEWQRDFFDHRIRDLDTLQEKEAYIAMNPVRQGMCDLPEDWLYVWRSGDLEHAEW